MAKFGLKDFWKFAREEELLYSVFAVQASLEQVSHAVAAFYGHQDIISDVLADEYVAEPRILSNAIPIIAVKKTTWTIIYPSRLQRDRSSEPCSLSKNLQARVIHFYGEMDSEFMAYEIIDDGQVVEKAHFNGLLASTPFTFDSQLRSAPQLPWLDVDDVYENQQIFQEFVNDFCQEQQLYLPVCYQYWPSRTDLKSPSPLLLRVLSCSKRKVQTANFVGDVVNL